MALGCHGSCFTNYPGGHAPPLCPHFLCAVCIVRGIIFPNAKLFPQTLNSRRDDSHLTNPRTARKIQMSERESTALTRWLPLLVLDVLARYIKQKNPLWIPLPGVSGCTCFVCHHDSSRTLRTALPLTLFLTRQFIYIPDSIKGHPVGNILLIFKVAKLNSQ